MDTHFSHVSHLNETRKNNIWRVLCIAPVSSENTLNYFHACKDFHCTTSLSSSDDSFGSNHTSEEKLDSTCSNKSIFSKFFFNWITDLCNLKHLCATDSLNDYGKAQVFESSCTVRTALDGTWYDLSHIVIQVIDKQNAL